MQVLGLTETASLTEAKSAFRRLAKDLHPDRTPATPETLRRLADAVAAIRLIESVPAIVVDLEITAAEAKAGINRVLKVRNQSVMFRIPQGAASGEIIQALGEPGISARILVQPKAAGMEPKSCSDHLDEFVRDFVDQSPNSRFAKWVRKARSAA
ncbi:DnaJ domain-containing protein [Hyphobacterium sp.]|uniref:DnaJ domain-containing protein n=1 Tax=Hyphobacterium sp. TaxID=2004662 RepID=UPI003BAA1EEE